LREEKAFFNAMLWHESVGLLDALQTSQMIKLSRSASLGTLVETITTTPAITMQKKKKSSVGIVHQGMAIMVFRH